MDRGMDRQRDGSTKEKIDRGIAWWFADGRSAGMGKACASVMFREGLCAVEKLRLSSDASSAQLHMLQNALHACSRGSSGFLLAGLALSRV
eukprot:324424-Pelagomonas_calceolata.AAC.8